MNFTFRSLEFPARSTVARELEEQIDQLQELGTIDAAEVLLERLRHPKGAFRLQVHLAVPGPDFRAECTGYTPQETVVKMQKELRRRMQIRSRRPGDRGLNGRRPVSNRK
jgi:hypothetical protein